MPSFNITIPETIESVTRPIVYSVINTIKKYLMINDIRIIFPGDINQWTQTDGTLGKKTKDSQFTSSRYIEIDVEQNPVDTNLGSTAIYYGENPPIIYDKDVGLNITPIYSNTDVTLNIRFVTYNKDEAFRWYYNVRTEISRMQDVYINTIKYHYPLPYPVIDLVKTIYELKENIAGDGITFEQYRKDHFSAKITEISSLDGKDKRLAVAETQTRILGRFEFDPLPEKPELIDEIQAWVCSFSYKFNYSLPMSLNLKYPVMVHNQLLPKPFLDYDLDPYELDDKNLEFPYSLYALRDFEPYRISDYNIAYRIPKIDDFVTLYGVPGYKAIFYALIQLDENNLTYICNLKDLDYLELSPYLLEFISQVEYQYITTPYDSAFHITLYKGQNMVDNKYLICKPNLDIYCTVPLNLKNVYHISLESCFDFNSLRIDAIERLFNFTPKPELKSYTVSEDMLGTPIKEVCDIDMRKQLKNVNLVPTGINNNTVEYSNEVDSNYSIPPVNKDTLTYIDLHEKIPINLKVIENYESQLLNSDTSKVEYSNYFNTQTNIKDNIKYKVLNNSFFNVNLSLPKNPSGSEIFKQYCNLVKVSPYDLNTIYMHKKHKNLFNDLITTDGFLFNTRTPTNKLFDLMSRPLYTYPQNQNYIDFKSVMISGVVTVATNTKTIAE